MSLRFENAFSQEHRLCARWGAMERNGAGWFSTNNWLGAGAVHDLQ